MTRVAMYRRELKRLEDWDRYLLLESKLPGPRANLELARAVAEEGDREKFFRYLTFDPEKAPVNSQEEFLAFCGVLGLGRLLAEGDREALKPLREHASDPRWRIREAVAFALQRLGAVDMDALLEEMRRWIQGSLFERRAAVVALCEPDLIRDEPRATSALEILDSVTSSLLQVEDRNTEAFRVLRKGLAFCWSVAVAALPASGKRLMERWIAHEDRDVRWIMQQNLKKKRLIRLDSAWVESMQKLMEA